MKLRAGPKFPPRQQLLSEFYTQAPRDRGAMEGPPSLGLDGGSTCAGWLRRWQGGWPGPRSGTPPQPCPPKPLGVTPPASCPLRPTLAGGQHQPCGCSRGFYKTPLYCHHPLCFSFLFRRRPRGCRCCGRSGTHLHTGVGAGCRRHRGPRHVARRCLSPQSGRPGCSDSPQPLSRWQISLQ